MRAAVPTDDGRNRSAMTEYEIAEIFIFGQQNSLLCLCAQHDFGVAGSRRDFRHVDDVMPGGAQVGHQPVIKAFIHEPADG
jgi:hypothetical protein